MASNRVLAIALAAFGIALGSTVLLERKMAGEMYTFDPRAQPSAVYGLRVTVPPSSRVSFIRVVREFAASNGLAEKVRVVKPGTDLTYIDLWRSDIAVGGGNLFDAPDFELAFYIDPTRGGTVQAASQLADDFATAVSGVTGVTVARTK